jgi:HEAT repeat protein
MASSGPFRGLVPYDEASRDAFFGRDAERDALVRMVLAERFRIGLLTGAPGVGKTSLVRAGLIPQLSDHGALAVYLSEYGDFERGLARALLRARGEGAGQHDDAAALLAELCAEQPHGAVLIFDHIGDALARDSEGRPVPYDRSAAGEIADGVPVAGDESRQAAAGPPPRTTALVDELADFMTRVVRAASDRARFLLVVDTDRLFWLGALEQRLGVAIAPTARYALQPFSTRVATEVIEQTVLAGGGYFEDGLSAAIATDLTQDGPAAASELQIVCKTAVDLRATTAARYRVAGGARALGLAFLDRAVEAAGGEPAMRLMGAMVDLPGRQTLALSELAEGAGLPQAAAERAAHALLGGGVVRRERDAGGNERYGLAHEVLASRARDYLGGLRQKMVQARLTLQRRLAASSWLRPRELRLVRRYGGATLGPEGVRLVAKSVRILQMAASAVVFGSVALFGLLYMRAANSYQARIEEGRVVVRLARPSAILAWLPHTPAFGAVLGDTGVPANSLTDAARVELERGRGGLVGIRDQQPSWLAETIDRLRPVLRGSALIVVGRPEGYEILRQAFRDPGQQRDVLARLQAIGRGERAEGEILMAALAADDLELRRRAVEVAVGIDARRPGALKEVLAAALRDGAAGVARTVVREAAGLEPGEAAALLQQALGAGGPVELRRAAVEAAEALAARSVEAAADALRPAVADADPATRRAALALLSRLLEQSPTKVRPVLERVAADEGAREEQRVAALLALRQGHVDGAGDSAALVALLEKAAGGGSERLRSAALPLLARVGQPQKALELAQAVQAGAPALRAAAAAAYGALAGRGVDVTAPLKALAADSNLEVRVEAIRALAGLGKDALPLLEKAAFDGNAEVERAAIEAAGALAHVNAYGVATLLDKVLRSGRASLRRSALEQMGAVGEVKPPAATTALSRALKDRDPQLRQGAVTGMCAVARKAVGQVLPYLKVALRDEDAGVRLRLAACARKDPALGARFSPALAADADPAVRVAAAEALGAMGAKNADGAVLAQLVADRDRAVRLAALKVVGAVHVLREPDKTLAAAFVGADAEEKRLLVETAHALKAPAPVRLAAADSDPAVRRAAIEAAPLLGDRGVKLLAGALEDRDAGVRMAAMRVLASLAGGAAEAVAALERIVRHGAADEREAALAALADGEGAVRERAQRLIGETLEQRSEALRVAAARAGGRLAARDPARAVPLLERALGDRAYDVRRAATPGLALAFAKTLQPAELAARLAKADQRASLRAALLEALARQTANGPHEGEARTVLERVAVEGGPLQRFGAALVRGFGGSVEDLDGFLAEIVGG